MLMLALCSFHAAGTHPCRAGVGILLIGRRGWGGGGVLINLVRLMGLSDGVLGIRPYSTESPRPLPKRLVIIIIIVIGWIDA